jgi:hypothetical protein
MDSNDISTVSEHKHLGLVISDNGSWEKHIDMITGKAYKRINILRKFKFILDRKTVIAVHVEWGMIRFVDFSRNSHGFRFLSIESNQPFR